jgi:hypothetical protein
VKRFLISVKLEAGGAEKGSGEVYLLTMGLSRLIERCYRGRGVSEEMLASLPTVYFSD